MAYDELLASQLRDLLADAPGVTEKKMFGGLCLLLEGKMFMGIIKDELMVRVGPERWAEHLAKPGVREMDFTGRSMKGYVYVGAEAIRSPEELAEWIEAGRQFVAEHILK